MAGDVLGAAEDGGVKVLIMKSSSGGTHAQHTHAAPRAALGRHLKGGRAKGVAQDVAEGATEVVTQDMAQDLAFGGRVARALLATPPPPPLLPPPLCSSR